MTIIKESGMAFGDYDDKNLFKIENSSIHTLAGLNIKSVEFILLDNCKCKLNSRFNQEHFSIA